MPLIISNTLQYGLAIANKGLEKAVSEDKNIRNGLNVYMGKCTNKPVAKSLGIEYSDIEF